MVKRRIRVVGIGAGKPEHMTVEAIEALGSCDVLFIPHKGGEKAFLAELRRGICARFITGREPRLVHFTVPKRRTGGDDYGEAVADWHEAIATLYERMLADEVTEDETVGLLVWGDPMLYDSTIRIVETVRARGRIAVDFDVIPGISSLQALCARHRIPLNRIGGAVAITTGRRFAQGWPEGATDVAVMLDAGSTAENVDDPQAEIFWGAYLGTEMELTLAGRAGDVAPEISRVRAAARAQHGWIMDTTLVRRAAPGTNGEKGEA